MINRNHATSVKIPRFQRKHTSVAQQLLAPNHAQFSECIYYNKNKNKD